MHILCRMYSFIPVGYKPKNLIVSKYKCILNAGYFRVLTESFYIWIHKWPNEMGIESINYSAFNPYVYLLILLGNLYIYNCYKLAM